MLDVQKNGAKADVKISEDLVGSRIDDLRTELSEVMHSGINEMTIDLEGVETIDSLGMGLLVATHNSLKSKQGHLRLINVASNIYNVLVIMRLDKHFPIQKAE